MTLRLDQALEITDGLWDLVPVIAAASEAHAQRHLADVAGTLPVARTLPAARPAVLRLGRDVSPDRAGGAAHKGVDRFAALPAALDMDAGIVAVAPSAAVEDQARGGDSGLGRSAHIQHVRGQGQRLTWARAVSVPQAPSRRCA